MATARPINSDFQDGWRGVTTLVPSVLIIFLGSAIKRGIVTPIHVSTKKPIFCDVSLSILVDEEKLT